MEALKMTKRAITLKYIRMIRLKTAGTQKDGKKNPNKLIKILIFMIFYSHSLKKIKLEIPFLKMPIKTLKILATPCFK